MIAHLACMYNELPHVRQWIENVLGFADEAVVYDDGSTDGSYEILREYLPERHIIRGKENDWAREVEHHAAVYHRIQELFPKVTHISTLGCDERIPGPLLKLHRERILALGPRDAMVLKHAECYRSRLWWRTDSFWSCNAFTRAWRHDPRRVRYPSNPQIGVHNHPIPQLAKLGFHMHGAWPGHRTIHLGWGSTREILEKFGRYADLFSQGRWGNAGHYLNFVRVLDERGAKYLPMPDEWLDDPWMTPSNEFKDEFQPPPMRHQHGWIIDETHKWWYLVRKYGLPQNITGPKFMREEKAL